MGNGPKSLRDKLEAAARQTGKTIQEIHELVDLPDSMSFVWRYFIDLHNARSFGNSINPIAYSDMKAYFDMYSIVPMDWEINTIKQLDVIAMNAYSEEAEKEAAKNSKKTKK